jgi:hypothetical protein
MKIRERNVSFRHDHIYSKPTLMIELTVEMSPDTRREVLTEDAPRIINKVLELLDSEELYETSGSRTG